MGRKEVHPWDFIHTLIYLYEEVLMQKQTHRNKICDYQREDERGEGQIRGMGLTYKLYIK